MNTVINSNFWSIAFYDAEDWALRKVYHIYLESFEMWCWRWTEKMVSKGRVGKEEVLHTIPHAIDRKKAN